MTEKKTIEVNDPTTPLPEEPNRNVPQEITPPEADNREGSDEDLPNDGLNRNGADANNGQMQVN